MKTSRNDEIPAYFCPQLVGITWRAAWYALVLIPGLVFGAGLALLWFALAAAA